MKKLLLIACMAITSLLIAQRPFYGAKFEPKDFLIGAGQSDIFTKANVYAKSWNDFKTATGITPDLYMDYYPLGTGKLNTWSTNFKNGLPAKVIPQIGVGFYNAVASKNLCKDIIDKKLDTEILAFGDFLASLKRKVFLRPGLEFDLKFYGYIWTDYGKAYRRFVDLIRSKTDSVAFVWCGAGRAGYGAWAMPGELDKWYPGGDWVDWLGTDWLQGSTELAHPAFPIYFQWAATKKKPIMIGEFTPYVVGAASWNQVFVDMFKALYTYPQIKALCYINWDWKVENANRTFFGYSPGWERWGNAILKGDVAKQFALAVKALSAFIPSQPLFDTVIIKVPITLPKMVYQTTQKIVIDTVNQYIITDTIGFKDSTVYIPRTAKNTLPVLPEKELEGMRKIAAILRKEDTV